MKVQLVRDISHLSFPPYGSPLHCNSCLNIIKSFFIIYLSFKVVKDYIFVVLSSAVTTPMLPAKSILDKYPSNFSN